MNLIYNTMQMNQVLGRGDYMVTGGPVPGLPDSPFSHNAFLAMQGDGNLVLYRRRHINTAFEPIWPSGTNGTDASWCVLQLDGNLVLVNDHYVARWGAGVNRPLGVQATLHLYEWGDGRTGNAVLKLIQNGNVVWHVGDPDPIPELLHDTLTSRKQLLLTQLHSRYGSIPGEVEQAVEASEDAEQLADWILKVITVKDLAAANILRYCE